MSDLIYKEDAIKLINKATNEPQYQHENEDWVCGLVQAKDIIQELPSAEPQGELVNKDDAIKAVANYIWHLPNKCYKNFNSYNDIEEVVTDAIKQLPSTNDNWIPVSERLPNKDGQYLVQTNWLYHGTENMDVFTWAEGWNCYRRLDGTVSRENEIDGKDFVAWQPLPTPYREDSEA